MALTVNAQRITRASPDEFDTFSICRIMLDGATINLFLPSGTAQSVANAINVAIAKGAEK